MVENAGKVQMSVCGGDSGGPVFRIGRAYGIVGAGVNVQSLNPPLNVTSPIATYELRCGDATLYQGMYGALAATNTHLVVQ
jgi:secreted trypsin-like serine protease